MSCVATRISKGNNQAIKTCLQNRTETQTKPVWKARLKLKVMWKIGEEEGSGLLHTSTLPKKNQKGKNVRVGWMVLSVLKVMKRIRRFWIKSGRLRDPVNVQEIPEKTRINHQSANMLLQKPQKRRIHNSFWRQLSITEKGKEAIGFHKIDEEKAREILRKTLPENAFTSILKLINL